MTKEDIEQNNMHISALLMALEPVIRAATDEHIKVLSIMEVMTDSDGVRAEIVLHLPLEGAKE